MNGNNSKGNAGARLDALEQAVKRIEGYLLGDDAAIAELRSLSHVPQVPERASCGSCGAARSNSQCSASPDDCR